MVQINFALKEVNCKVVYYGPGMSGKTTNLEIVHKKAPEQNRGDLTSISTDGDRTLFFDYMPLDLGTIAGMRTKFQLYTVPGQVYYNSTRKLVLQGVDGVVFVADSDPAKMKENLESFANLEENLREYGKELKSMPHVIQWNKRDLPGALTVEELNAQVNKFDAPSFEAIARTGEGVFPTLKALAALVLEGLNRREAAPKVAPKAAAPSSALPNPVPAMQPAYASAPPASSPAPEAAQRPRPAVRAVAAAAPATVAAAAPVRSAAPTRPAAAPRASARPVPARPVAAAHAPAASKKRTAAPAAQEPVQAAEPQKSGKGVWVGIVLGAIGALAVLGVVFLFLLR